MDIRYGENAFAILAAVEQLFRKTDRRADWPAVSERMRAGDYDHLCKVAEEVSYGAIGIVGRDEPDEEEE